MAAVGASLCIEGCRREVLLVCRPLHQGKPGGLTALEDPVSEGVWHVLLCPPLPLTACAL
jgi:hypothetical protein